MPLRFVHVTFIVAAAVMAAGVGAWSVNAWLQGDGAFWAGLAAVALIGSGSLIVYGGRFLRKMRRLGIVALALAVTLGLPDAALACPACVGTTDSPLQAGMNLGILTLVGVITVILTCFGAFFVHLARRAGQATVASPVGPAVSSTLTPQRGDV